MIEKSYITRDARGTERVGEELVENICSRRLILLYGSLGAGKTTFVKGLCKGLGFDGVTSPSFVLVNIYPTEPVVYHIDLYRLKGRAEIEGTEIEDLLYSPDGIAVVEWAEKLEGFPLKERIDVYLSIIGRDEREIKVVWV